VREGRELGSKLNYRRSPAAENQPTNPPSSNPISGANRTSVVTLTRIPSATPTAAPRTTAQMRLRSLVVPSAIGDRESSPPRDYGSSEVAYAACEVGPRSSCEPLPELRGNGAGRLRKDGGGLP
jgi:hypothetical protein